MLTPQSSRRLLSRLSTPFTPKSRHVTDFNVQIDDPHKQYTPGEQLTGCVHLKVVKPIRITHLVVCLHGFVQVYKNPGNPPTDGYRTITAHIGTGRGSKSGEYFGNGFASLFEDEVVLCGDGRLGEGVYQFNFDLEFPDRDLPSSISFERGTISYLVTATLTRPTTISPTIQCDHKVYFVERIDISHLYPPKARTITLEPLTRRTARARTQARRLVDSDRRSRKGDSNQRSSERRESQTSSSPSHDGMQSPVPSEVSFDSFHSSQEQASQQESNLTSPRQSDGSRWSNGGPSTSIHAKTITATIESSAGGCLRGDTLQIKVLVNHTKHVKSLHGAIFTLYRHARVDLHPAIPIGPVEKGKEAKYEDYYPKSMTGLGGLSLSGAGSSHVFRKDISQSVVPLIVDPQTLSAELVGKVSVPEEAFPTISTVPGGMISFRYYIEVVLDIQGKLSSQDRNLGNLGGLASTMNQGQRSTGADRDRSAFGGVGAPVIDTAAVRRDKGVVSCTFEVVVGTKDSARKKGKRKVGVVVDSDSGPIAQQEQQPQQGSASDADNGASHGDQWYGHGPGYDARYFDHGQHDQYGDGWRNGYSGAYDHYGYMAQHGHYDQPPPIPMPPPEDRSQLSEKERMRLAEARLLPSQPPGGEEESTEGAHAPTAPYLPEEQPDGYPEGSGGTASRSIPIVLTPPAQAGPSNGDGTAPVSIDFARSVPLPRTPEYERVDSRSLPRTPDYESLEPITLQTSNSGLPPTEDKRELERRSLQVEASAPPAADERQASAAHVPSAPEEEDLYANVNDSHADAGPSNCELPRYEPRR
ncbi:pH-response regulator palF RIM8 [Lecanosticta acicola]|uniref:PH-response regulator palF RIM8 n=1 Tax=Lecanosticta acicola TaxID=111012 RepID=A0AAI9EAL0_9PEZI|nr:pH-response regulator palF RIM8 [Lecanosticta acicola]